MKSRMFFLFYLLMGYVLIQFVWWSYLLFDQNNEIYELKKRINLFQYSDPQLIIEKGNELEKKLRGRWIMIVGEGMVFLALLLFVFWKVRSTFKKESELAERQKNFLLSVTHELKSPIASAKLALETVLKRELEKEKRNEVVLNAIKDTDRLNSLVENILLASHIESASFRIHKESVNLSQYLEETIKQAVLTFNPTQKIVLDIQPHIIFSIDKTIFPSIILNLFENAVKYSPDNSTITICLKKQRNKIALLVSDEGTGIPSHEKEKIFQKFYRIGGEETRKTKGTGLGLHIVKYLVEKHGGNIFVKDNIPKGSIFEVIL